MKRLFALLFAFGSFVAARSGKYWPVVMPWPSLYCPSAACTEGEIRLNSTDSRAHRLEPLSVAAGRVEVCMRNKWGTVCSTGFGTQEAMVVCRQLGYLTTGKRARPSLHDTCVRGRRPTCVHPQYNYMHA